MAQDDEQRTVAEYHETEYIEHYSSIVPHPATIHQYEQILPGSGERLLALVEREQDHRMRLENRLLNGQQLGRWFGFISSMTTIIVGALVVTAGYELPGSAIAIAPVTINLAIFIRHFRNRPGDNIESTGNETG